jgi:hypothetical protein
MRKSLLLPLIIACALFMEGMDSSVIATSLPAIALVQQLSQGLGVTFGAAVLQIAMAVNGEEAPGISEFHGAFVGAGLIGLVSLIFFAKLHNTDGAEVSGYRGKSKQVA